MILLSKRNLLGFVFSCLLLFLCIGIGLFQQAKEEYHLFDDSPTSSLGTPTLASVVNSTPEECVAYLNNHKSEMNALAKYLEGMKEDYTIFIESDVSKISNDETSVTIELIDFGDKDLEQMIDQIFQDGEIKLISKFQEKGHPDKVHCEFHFGALESKHCILCWGCPSQNEMGYTVIDKDWSYYEIAAMDE